MLVIGQLFADILIQEQSVLETNRSDILAFVILRGAMKNTCTFIVEEVFIYSPIGYYAYLSSQ